MEDMQLVAERLVVRCQEASMQLELTIHRKMCEFDPNSNQSFVQIQDYYSFLARLSSLKLRADHIQGTLRHEQKDPTDTNIQYETLERLIYEFQDITLSLNELAQDQNSPQKSSCSGSSNSSASIPLRSLKIIERNRNTLLAASPIRRKGATKLESSSKKTVVFKENLQTSISALKRSSSLPGSPVPDTLLESDMAMKEMKTLRLAKSYDFNLNRGRQESNIKWEFFKNKNRLSLSVFDDIDMDASDEETVISISPPAKFSYLGTANYTSSDKLRRCNSHDSVLSIKIENLRADLSLRQEFTPTWRRPSIRPTISSSKIYSVAHTTTESKNESKDILSRILAPSKEKSRGWFASAERSSNTDSFFSKWFNSKSLVTTEVGNPLYSSPSKGRRIIVSKQAEQHSAPKISTVFISPDGSKFVRGLSEPLLNRQVSYNQLKEALSTEFKF